jgi:MOSC domain-containing protein YiiM
MPHITALWIKRARRGVMDAVDAATAIAGRGFEGNAGFSRFRQVTLIEHEAWDAMMRELGADVSPAARRANVMVTGFPLARSRGRLIAIGDVRLRVRGETRPCERMDEAFPGLRAAMDPDWRGGVFAQVEVGGRVQVGDEVRWVDEDGG